MKKETKESFEDFLQNRHMEIFPEVLDDDLCDHFDNWLSELDVEQMLGYAQVHGLNQYVAGMNRAEEIRNEVKIQNYAKTH